MKKTPKTLVKLMCATIVPTILVSSLYVNAEPGVLQNVPFITTAASVQPNILFILDDSTSMDWEQLLFDGTEQARIYNDFVPNRSVEYLRSCAGYNRLYFNPDITYTPWAGVDENGEPFRDQDIDGARTDPYRASTNRVNIFAPSDSVTVTKEVTGRIISQTISTNNAGGYNYMTSGNTSLNGTGFVGVDRVGLANLLDPQGNGGLSAGYMIWNDSNGNGTYQTGECSTSPSDFIRLSDIYASDPNDPRLTNFANWFTYYRSRSFTAKNALLSIIDESRARIGVMPLFDPNRNSGTVNNGANAKVSGAPADGTFILGSQNGTNGGGIPIKDIDTVGKVGDELRDAQEAKSNLLAYVASSTSSLIGTPLRNSLNQAGRYYHQNLTPNPRAFRGGSLHDSTEEGTLNDNSPILNANNGGVCQRHFTVLFSDGFATFDSLDNAVGNTDSDGIGPFDGGTFADNPSNRSNTLADFAMFYLENDLAPGNGTSGSALANNVGAADSRRPADVGAGIPAGVINHQHMTTYTIAFGIRDPSSGSFSNRDPNPTETFFNWPTNSIADMRHAAWNGRGRFLNSATSEELVNDVQSIFSEINAQVENTTTASSVSSGFVSQGSLVFQTQFDSTDWSGNLFAYRFDANNIIDIDDPVFDVASELNSRLTNDNVFVGSNNNDGYSNSRFIFTKAIDLDDLSSTASTPNSLQADNGALFSFDNLTSSQKAVFTSERSSIGFDWVGSDIEFGRALVDYLAGDSTHEQGVSGELAGDGGQRIFRDRGRNYLGAIVNSSPEFVGIPNENYPDQIEGSEPNELYSGFITRQSSRTPIVYVGANDGMLHAFNASVDVTGSTVSANANSGNEIFAYIPAVLTAELPQLASPSYNFDSFVDATPTVRDVFINNQWATYLVAGLRNGARAIYALDVTDPVGASSSTQQARARSIAKFEYTHPDLGFTYSRIQIARMNNGSWVAIVGNGYNSVGDGRGKLFIIDLATGLPLSNAGPLGSNGIFDTGVGSIMNNLCTDAGSDCNGLSEPTIVDLNGDFITDRIYAGDLHGNMWVFNVQSANPSEWTMTRLFTATQSNCTVSSANDCRQPITTRPVVSLHPSRRSLSTEPNVLVLFGTGQFIAEGDASNTENQSFYSVWDTTGASATANNSNLVKSDLVVRTFGGTIDAITISGPTANYDTSASPSPLRNFGWYIDLAGSIAPESGTSGASSDPFDRGRVSINPIVSGSVVFFVTTVPSAGEACLPGTIPGFLSALDVESGQTPNFDVFVDDSGMGLGTSTIALVNGAVGLDLDTTGAGKQTRVTNVDGTITQDKVSDSIDVPVGRKAWSILR